MINRTDGRGCASLSSPSHCYNVLWSSNVLYSSREHWAIKKKRAPPLVNKPMESKVRSFYKTLCSLLLSILRIVNVCDGDSPKCGHTLEVIRLFLRLFILYNFDRDNIWPWLIPRVITGPHLFENIKEKFYLYYSLNARWPTQHQLSSAPSKH